MQSRFKTALICTEKEMVFYLAPFFPLWEKKKINMEIERWPDRCLFSREVFVFACACPCAVKHYLRRQLGWYRHVMYLLRLCSAVCLWNVEGSGEVGFAVEICLPPPPHLPRPGAACQIWLCSPDTVKLRSSRELTRETGFWTQWQTMALRSGYQCTWSLKAPHRKNKFKHDLMDPPLGRRATDCCCWLPRSGCGRWGTLAPSLVFTLALQHGGAVEGWWGCAGVRGEVQR